MFRRVSLNLEEKSYKKIVKLQAKRIKKTKQGCSFSSVIAIVLERGIKSMKKQKKKKKEK